MTTKKSEMADNIQAAYDALDTFREFNRMSAEDQELILNVRQLLVDAGAEEPEEG